MTQEEFNQLPLLLRRKEFLAVTGLSKGRVYEMIQAGTLRVVRRPWRKRRRGQREEVLYLKREAARLGGMDP
jgi:hypothetical protein